jgi:hypothetical protein
MNIATTKDLIEFPKNRIGWYVGGSANISIHKKFFLQPELLYSTEGHKSYGLQGNSKMVLRLNYINVPILLGYDIDRKTQIVFGPSFGYLASVYIVYDNNENFNISKNYSPKFDAGLDIGLNYNIIKKIGIEVRYNYGFKLLYYIDGAGIAHKEAKGANRVFQIGFKYIFK